MVLCFLFFVLFSFLFSLREKLVVMLKKRFFLPPRLVGRKCENKGGKK